MAQKRQTKTKEEMPDEFREGIIKLILFEDEVINKMLETVRNSAPTFEFNNIIELIAETHNLDVQDVFEIIKTIVTIQDFCDTQKKYSIEECVEIIINNTENDNGLSELEFTNEQIDKLKSRILNFLQEGNILKLALDAQNLLLEYPNIFLDSKVVTDIRPIFNNVDSQNSIGNALIVHNLKVVYKTMTGNQEFFVALQSYEIIEIINQLDKALENEDSLKSFFKTANISHLSLDSEE